jgi:hypothetical protein
MHRLADLSPVESRGVGGMHHPLVLLGSPVRGLEQGPYEVEQVGREPALLLRVGVWARGIVRHQVLLSVGELSQTMQDALVAPRPRLEARAVLIQQPGR